MTGVLALMTDAFFFLVRCSLLLSAALIVVGLLSWIIFNDQVVK